MMTLAMFAGFGSPAGAQDTSDVYVVHGIPGVDVDVYVNDALTLGAFKPKDIAGPLALPAGTYEIKIFAAIDSPPDSAADRTDAAVIDVSPEVPAGLNLSVVAFLDADAKPTLKAFVNDLSATAAGNGRVTVRHTAAAPAVDIVAAGAAVPPFVNLANGDEAKADLPAGDYPTGIAAAGTTEVLVEAPVTVTDGTNLVVYAIGDLAGGTFELLTQSFDGLASAPTAVAAGNSGLLDSSSSAPLLLIAGLIGLGGVSGLAVLANRRRV
jgi:hypothetical protein